MAEERAFPARHPSTISAGRHAPWHRAARPTKNFIESYPDLQGRILEHLEETRLQADELERCIRRLGTATSPLKDSAAAFIGNMQALSGLFLGDEVVKGAMASYTFEHLEIASYRR